MIAARIRSAEGGLPNSFVSRVAAVLNNAIKVRGLALERAGLRALDALHLACAEAMGAEVFLTCDDRLLRRYSGQMRIENPVTFATRLR